VVMSFGQTSQVLTKLQGNRVDGLCVCGMSSASGLWLLLQLGLLASPHTAHVLCPYVLMGVCVADGARCTQLALRGCEARVCVFWVGF
jgi:hypothetical protein